MQIMQYPQNKYQNNLLQSNNNANHNIANNHNVRWHGNNNNMNANPNNNNNNLTMQQQLALPLPSLQNWCKQKGLQNLNGLTQQQKMQIIIAYKQYIFMAMKYNQSLDQVEVKVNNQNQQQKKLQEKVQQQQLKVQRRRARPPVPKFSEETLNEMTFEMPEFQDQKPSQDFVQTTYENNNNFQVKHEEQEQEQESMFSFSVKQEQNSSEECDIQSTDDSSNSNDNSNSNSNNFDLKNNSKLQILVENIEELLQNMNIKNNNLFQKVVEITKVVLEKQTNILKNRSTQTIAAALIIHASRMVGAPLTTRKVAKFIDCKERTLNKIFNLLRSNFEELSESQRPSPAMFINKIVQNLKIQNNVHIVRGIEFFVRQFENLGQIQGLQAGTIAACAVKVSCHLYGKDFSFKEISDASDVCQISVRHCYTIFMQNKDYILAQPECPKNFICDPKYLPKHNQNNTNCIQL